MSGGSGFTRALTAHDHWEAARKRRERTAPACGFCATRRQRASPSWCRSGCGGSSARRRPASDLRRASTRSHPQVRATDRAAAVDAGAGRSCARGPARCPDDGRLRGSGQPEHPAAADRPAAGPRHRGTPAWSACLAQHLERDLDAVTAGLTRRGTPCRGGPCPPDQGAQAPDVRPLRLSVAPRARPEGTGSCEPGGVCQVLGVAVGVDAIRVRRSTRGVNTRPVSKCSSGNGNSGRSSSGYSSIARASDPIRRLPSSARATPPVTRPRGGGE